MAGIAKTEVVVPKELSMGQREAFARSLYAVHARIFDGVDYESFREYVVFSKADRTWILLYKNREDEVVGYFAWHLYEKRLGGRPVAVFRAEAGMLRAYRGGNSTTLFAFSKLVPYIALHPGKPIYYLGCLVHPSSYSLFAKFAPTVYPSRRGAVPPDVLRFMDELATEFHLERVDPDNVFVRKVGWKTRDSEVERNYWLGTTKPDAQYYLQANPTYVDGNGLVTLVPMTVRVLGNTARIFAREQLARQRQIVEASLRRTILPPRKMEPAEVRTLLAQVAIVEHLTMAQISKVVAASTIESIPSGTYVFKRGDRGDAMYVVLSGAAYVIDERDGEEELLDQLERGEAFGEIAMLTGESRSASIRSATPLTVLKIPRAAFLQLMQEDQGIHDGVWRAFAVRRFRSYLPTSSRFARVSRDGRKRWAEAGTLVSLDKGSERAVPEGVPYLFVMNGTADVEQGGAWLSVRGPSLLELRAGTRLTSHDGANVLLLPSPERYVGTAAPAMAATAS